MKTRTELLVKNRYKITQTALDSSFLKVYRVIGLVDNKSYFLVDLDKPSTPPAFLQEMRIWLEHPHSAFLDVVENWDDLEFYSLVVSDFQGLPLTDLVAMSAADLEESKAFALLPELQKFFQQLFEMKISLNHVDELSNRTYYSAEGKVKLLPSAIYTFIKSKSPLVSPILNDSHNTDPKPYIKLFGRSLFYLLTQNYPNDNGAIPPGKKIPLDTAQFLKSLLLGTIDSFPKIGEAFQTLLKEREQKRIERELEKASTEASLPFLKKEKPRANIALLSSFIALMKFSRAVVEGVILLLYIISSYYLEKVVWILKKVQNFFSFLMRLNPETIREEMAKMREDIVQIRVSISEIFPVNQSDLLQFTRHLAVLLRAGISYNRSIEILYIQSTNRRLKNALAKVYAAVVGKGLPLSKAVALVPDVFPELFRHMLEAGDATGKMDEVLDQIGNYLERDLSLRQKVKSASTYPIIICIACFGLFSFFVYVILPKFIEIFNSLHVTLPLPTVILIGIVNFFHSPLTMLFVIGGLILVYFPVRAFLKTVLGRGRIDLLKLQMPVFGSLFKKLLLARFCSTLATLVECGVPLLQALDVTGRASGNEFFNNTVVQMIEETRAGTSLTHSIEGIAFFPPLVRSMTQVGEESGSLELMLMKAAHIYEEEVDFLLQKFVALLEPVLLAIMGFVTGFVILAVFLPIYAVLQGIS